MALINDWPELTTARWFPISSRPRLGRVWLIGPDDWPRRMTDTKGMNQRRPTKDDALHCRVMMKDNSSIKDRHKTLGSVGRSASWALCAVLALGCGDNSGPSVGAVTGTITMNGQPVSQVNVTFIPEAKGSPSYGGTDDRGVYRLLYNHKRAGAELGKHNVIIQNREPETDDSGRRILSSATLTIPAKYQQPGTLTAEVRPGSNEVNFTLDAQ